jgi:hypothetical protein
LTVYFLRKPWPCYPLLLPSHRRPFEISLSFMAFHVNHPIFVYKWIFLAIADPKTIKNDL